MTLVSFFFLLSVKKTSHFLSSPSFPRSSPIFLVLLFFDLLSSLAQLRLLLEAHPSLAPPLLSLFLPVSPAFSAITSLFPTNHAGPPSRTASEPTASLWAASPIGEGVGAAEGWTLCPAASRWSSSRRPARSSSSPHWRGPTGSC